MKIDTMNNSQEIDIPVDEDFMKGTLTRPEKAKGLVLFVHGSGSSRFSPRNQYVAQILNKAGLATLLFDLLTPQEEKIDDITADYRFDIDLLTQRLINVTDWVLSFPQTRDLNIGYFGASTGAAAALLAAVPLSKNIKAIVSRGGRPDLAYKILNDVKAPTLLIVGGRDEPVIQMNQSAFQVLTCEKELLIIPGATHLFEEEGKLEEVAEAAKQWFTDHL